MEESLPVLDENADAKQAVNILRSSPAVLVEEFGKISGIVTRHDILEFL